MLIRCENCSTVYQLDEKMLPPEGAPVQCTRCQHVFTARPPEAPGQTLAAYPSMEPPEGSPLADMPPAGAPPPEGRPSRPEPAEPPQPQASAAADAPSPHGTEIYMGAIPPAGSEPFPPPPPAKGGLGTFTPLAESRRADGREPAPEPPGDEPEDSEEPEAAVEGPALREESAQGRRSARPTPPPRDPRNDTLRRFARDHQRRNLWKWLGPALGGGVVLLVILIVALASGGNDPKAVEKRAQALRLLAKDDRASLDEAVRTLESAHRIDPKYEQAEADRGLALFLEASSLADEVDLRSAAGKAPSSGSTDEAELAYKNDQAGKLRDQAFGLVSELYKRRPGMSEAARALAVAYALYGQPGPAGDLVKALRSRKLQDPWVDLAESAAALSGQDKSAAVAALGAFVTAHPEILRGRWLLARAQLDRGDRDAAKATLDGLLDANRSHELAGALKSSLLGLPPGGGTVPTRVPGGDPARGNPGPLPRK